jgi:hypothetical protein
MVNKLRRRILFGMAAFALPGLVKVGDSADYLSLIAPRPVMLTRGLWEWGKDGKREQWSKNHVQETREMETKARKTYARAGKPDNLKTIYFDEAGGNHDFPPNVRKETYKWLDGFLKRA